MNIVSKIPIKPLHQEVAGRVREMILKGALSAGDRIVEIDMCASLGISRTPFREALKILASEGLLELVPNKGTYVAKPSSQDVREMFEVMGILEGACARVAVERMTEPTFKRLESVHQTLEEYYEARDHGQYLTANHTYHVMIQELAANKVLDEVLNGLWQKIMLYRHRQLYQAHRFAASIQEHRDIMEAFKVRDADTAEKLMKLHLMNQCEAIVRLLDGGTVHSGDHESDRQRRAGPGSFRPGGS